MKKIIFLLAVFSGFYPPAFSQAAREVSEDRVYIQDQSFSFGKILENRPVTHLFKIVNNSKEPLQISDVQVTCGCTSPEWSKLAIAPGDSTFLKLGYNAQGQGSFHRQATVLFLGHPPKTITITGEVYAAPHSSVPVHPGLTLLKAKNK